MLCLLSKEVFTGNFRVGTIKGQLRGVSPCRRLKNYYGDRCNRRNRYLQEWIRILRDGATTECHYVDLSAPKREALMKIYSRILIFLLTMISLSSSAQCTKPDMNPVWDAGNDQFVCHNPTVAQKSEQDENISPTGDKDFCKTVRENLLKVCPPSDEGKACKDKAKSIFNSCYKGSKGRVNDSGSPTAASETNPNASACMSTFTQQQRACQSRRMPPPPPGQPSPPDTCLQDALAAQAKCLASPASAPVNRTSNTDASACMTTFAQQQKACQSRRMPSPPPGQPPLPDTCLQDALAAQTKCLANRP